MAKVKTSEQEEQLSVIAHLLSETQKNVKELRSTVDDLSLNKDSYKAFFIEAVRTSSNNIKSITAEEIFSMEKISKDVKENQDKALQSINKSLEVALYKIEKATEQKIKTAKQVYWLAGIVAIVLGITTVFLEVNRSIDKRIITEAAQGKFEVESWKADLKQWMKENPRDAKSFIEWSKSKSK